MEDLIKFVAAWEKTKNIETLLVDKIVLPAPAEVQVYLSSLPEDEHQRIRKSLDEALAALSSYTELMEQEAIHLKTQINQNIQASNACLTYNNATRKPRT